MKRNSKWMLIGVVVALYAGLAAAQALSGEELKKAIPTTYFFAGQSAPVQTRNSVGFKAANGKLVLAAFVDNSGYATGVKEKYQGLLITETKLNVGGNSLEPGQYGFGFKDDKVIVMNVASTDLFSADSKNDDQVKHPVPIKLEKDGDGYRLYAGKKYVVLKAE